MEIIADANIFLVTILNEPEKEKIISLTTGYDILSPLILPFEIGNAFSAMLKKKRLREGQVLKGFEAFKQIPVRLIDVDIKESLRIACEYNIYAYDAYYLETAKRLNLPLLSLDQKMIDCAKQLKIQTLEVL